MKFSISLAYKPKDAASLVTAQVDQIVDNLAKIFSHKPSTIDVEWDDEIKNKHLKEIDRKSNKTSDKKGHLRKDVLEAIWVSSFTSKDLYRGIFSVFSTIEYKKKAKSGEVEQVANSFQELSDKLTSLSKEFAVVILSGNIQQQRSFVDTLVDITKKKRDLLNG